MNSRLQVTKSCLNDFNDVKVTMNNDVICINCYYDVTVITNS
jgi:hypothetical protein